MTEPITAPHWLPPHEGCPLGRPAPPFLTEPEAMLLLRVDSRNTMTGYIRSGLRHDRRARSRIFRLEDVLDFMARRVCGQIDHRGSRHARTRLRKVAD